MEKPEPTLCAQVCDASWFVVYVVYRLTVGLLTAGESEVGSRFSTYDNWKNKGDFA